MNTHQAMQGSSKQSGYLWLASIGSILSFTTFPALSELPGVQYNAVDMSGLKEWNAWLICKLLWWVS